MPSKSAAFRRLPACFIALVRSGPCGIARASSRAARASASNSSLGRRTFFSRAIWDLVNCNGPVALWASKRRKSWPGALGSIAVNFIGEPQAVHCGPWFCMSSMCCSPSVRSPEFAGEPSGGSRFHRVARNDFLLYGVALRTFEQAMLKADWARTDARQHHARRAVRAARALDAGELRTRRELIF